MYNILRGKIINSLSPSTWDLIVSSTKHSKIKLTKKKKKEKRKKDPARESRLSEHNVT